MLALKYLIILDFARWQLLQNQAAMIVGDLRFPCLDRWRSRAQAPSTPAWGRAWSWRVLPEQPAKLVIGKVNLQPVESESVRVRDQLLEDILRFPSSVDRTHED